MSLSEEVYAPYTMLATVRHAICKRILRISKLNQAGAISQKTTEDFFNVIGKTVTFISEMEPRYKKDLELFAGYLRQNGRELFVLNVADYTIDSVDDDLAIMTSRTINLIKRFDRYASIDVDNNPHRPPPEAKALAKTSVIIWMTLEKKIDLFKDIEEKIYASGQQQEERRILRES